MCGTTSIVLTTSESAARAVKQARKSWRGCFSSAAPFALNSARCPALRLRIWTAVASRTTSTRSEGRTRPYQGHPKSGARAWKRGPGKRTKINGGHLSSTRKQEWHEAQEAEWDSLLVNTEFLDDNDRRSATVAGLVLFGKNPSRFLPQAEDRRGSLFRLGKGLCSQGTAHATRANCSSDGRRRHPVGTRTRGTGD